MSDKPTSRAVTLREAAAQLNVRPQRINQLLRDERLLGPSYPGRAPREAPRVWSDSLQQEKERRTREGAAGARVTTAELHERIKTLEGRVQALARRLEGSHGSGSPTDAAARSAAMSLKVGQDELMDRLSQARATVAELESALADAQTTVFALTAMKEDLRILADSRGDALTQLLTPDSPDAD